MPRLSFTDEPLEILINSSGTSNRENPGQWDEISVTHISKCIFDLAKANMMTRDEFFHEIIKLLSMCSPDQGVFFANWISNIKDDWEKDEIFYQMLDDGNLITSIKPMSESMTLDLLSDIYKAFDYVTQRRIFVPQESSTGKIRFIPARRLGVVGHMAMYRLQQYAEEKYSVTSLSPTNLRNENSRSKASKFYKSTHRATPVNIGDMEAGDLGHMGFENVITMLMIHSVSPHARRLVEAMFTDDPYLVDIKLDERSSNRSVEILNAYLKAIGYKLEFKKVKKVRTSPFARVKYVQPRPTSPFMRINTGGQQIKDLDVYYNWVDEMNEEASHRPFRRNVFKRIIKKDETQ